MRSDPRIRFPLPPRELERRWEIARDIMQQRELDVIVVQGANNSTGAGSYFAWLSGTLALGCYAQDLIFPRAGLMVKVMNGPAGESRALDGLDAAHPGVGLIRFTDAFPMVNYTRDYSARVVLETLLERGYKRVGIADPGSMYSGLASALSTCRSFDLVDVCDALDHAMAQKSTDEIELLHRAAQMQDDIFTRVCAFVKPGLREYEVFDYAASIGAEHGSLGGLFLGSSAPAGSWPTLRLSPQQGRTLERGDVLLFQAENSGPGGYYVHLGRYIVLGTAPAKLKAGFQAAVDAQRATLDLLVDDASPSEAFQTYNRYLQDLGMPLERRLHAHGQGCCASVERPLLADAETMSIAPGMNIGIHPTVLVDGALVTICDNFLTRGREPPVRLHATSASIFEL